MAGAISNRMSRGIKGAWAAAILITAASSVNAGTITFTGTIQTYTVATTGNYEIVAAGAQGGKSRNVNVFGGKGAVIDGTVSLTAGTVLKVVVGGQGIGDQADPSDGSSAKGGGGGGGTFVFVSGSGTPLIVAGGGGGAAECCVAGLDGQIGTDGLAGQGLFAGAGGTSGSGGGGGTVSGGSGGGGAGWFSNGGDGLGAYNGSGGFGPTTFAGGGGAPYAGGFGGGGGGSIGVGGGGGGYSGGGGAYGGCNCAGGGGGSFEASSVTLISATAGGNSGDGFVTITAAAPEPGSIVLLSLGLAGLAFAARRRMIA